MQKKSLCADDLLKETIEQYSPFVYRLAYSLVKSRIGGRLWNRGMECRKAFRAQEKLAGR